MLSIENTIDQMLTSYSQGEYYEELLKAKELYIALTGMLNDDDDEYESRMNLFNDWYLFNYRLKDGKRLVDDFVARNDFDEDYAKALLNVNYSLFQFKKINFKKEVVLNDILHNEKIILSKNNSLFGLVENDLFVGRVIVYQDKGYFLKGVCTLPSTILSNLKKEAKKIKKLNNNEEEERFLLKVENLKTRSKNYAHLDASQIFIFN